MSIRKLQFSGDTDDVNLDPELENNFAKILKSLALTSGVRDQDNRNRYKIETPSQRVGLILTLVASYQDELELGPNRSGYETIGAEPVMT